VELSELRGASIVHGELPQDERAMEEAMVRRFLAALAILAAVVQPGVLAWGASGFSNRTLRGNYVLEVAGLIANQFGTGEVTILGIVNFNGSGGITGRLTLTSSLEFIQSSCNANVDVQPGSSSSYSMNRDGTGNVNIQLSSSDPTSTGVLIFSSIIINPGVARLVLTNPNSESLSDLTICGVPTNPLDPIENLVLIGDMTRQQQ
jgi:hypothetical protein